MPNAATALHPHAATKSRTTSSPSQRVRHSRTIALSLASQRNDELAVGTRETVITLCDSSSRGNFLDIDFRQLRGNPFFSSFRDQLDVFIHVTSSCSSNCCAQLYARVWNPCHGRCNYLWFVLRTSSHALLRQRRRLSRVSLISICGTMLSSGQDLSEKGTLDCATC